jgi:phytoene dehydrogenase-like protein
MSRKVIIIGAGVAGLAAGVYLRRSGFDVTLIEQHNIVGGMCTSWKRKGYLFEGAMHWLTGSSPKTEAYQMWKEIGALDEKTPVLLHDPFRSVEWDGQIIHLYRDIDKTAEHLRTISPVDEPLLRQLVKHVKAVGKMQMLVFDIKGLKSENPKKMSLGFLFNMLHMLPAIPVMGRLGKMTCNDFAVRFRHPGIQRLFRIVPDEYVASSLIFTLATLHTDDGGYPEGGSLAMVHRMAKCFTDLGGELLLNTKVEKVNIHSGNAGESSVVTGVTLSEGELNADAVIVTQETVAALNCLFDTPPNDAWINELRETVKPAVCTFVSVGVRTELPDGMLPAWKLETPITYAGKTINEIYFNSYRRYAPEGGTALTTALMGDTYDFWKQSKDEGCYDDEKQALGEQFSRALCAKYPQCEGKIEVIDIATPLTYERYTGAYHGSWMSVIEPGDKMKQYPGNCENVNALYFAGQRLMTPGGLPSAAVSGRKAAQMVCRQFDVMFR